MLRILLVLLLVIPTVASSESVQVIEGAIVGVHESSQADSPVVSTLEGGHQLQATERKNGFVFVRSQSGLAGWVDQNLIEAKLEQPLPEPVSPAVVVPRKVNNTQLKKTKDQLISVEQELATAQQQLLMVKQELMVEKSKNADQALQLQENRQSMQLNQGNSSISEQNNTGMKGYFLWIIVSFAMLSVGFGAGVIWLREQNRRKLGGRYLRI